VVTDGNHKCHRLRCISDHHVTEVDNSIGCEYTPERGSYFCNLHNHSEPLNQPSNNLYELDDELENKSI